MSQENLAESVGVIPQLISRWENGQKKPGQSSINRLVQVFADQLSLEEARKWAWQAGQEIDYEVLHKFFNDKEDVSNPVPSIPAPLQHPSLPDRYVDRRNLQAKILRNLPPKSSRKSLVLCGPGGAGKSTLAAWVAEQLKSRFPDGVLWIEYTNVLDTQQQIAQSFQVNLPSDSPAKRAVELRILLRQKRCFIVLDDVWDNPDLGYLNVNDNSCPILITTRDRTIAYIFGAPEPIEVEGLTSQEGQTLLKQWGGKELNNAEIDLLLAKTENLPLALVLLGVQLQIGYTPAELLTALNQDPAGLAILDIKPPSTRDRSLIRSFDLSYEHLEDKSMQQYFVQSGCFAGSFTVSAVAAVWGLEGVDAGEVMHQLMRFRLINQAKENYRLHSLLRKYARWRLQHDWTELAQQTYERHFAYYILYYLSHPQLLPGATDKASDLDQAWPEIVAAIKWAAENKPPLAAQAVLLAHTERPALLEEIGPPLLIAIEACIKEEIPQMGQAILHEVLGDLYLLVENIAAGAAHFEQASRLWQQLEDGLAASQAKLRVAGSYLLRQDQELAAKTARQAQDLLEKSLPLKDEDRGKAERLFYWFNQVYNPLIRWVGLPEEDVANLAALADRTNQAELKARALNVYQLWCTTRQVQRSPEIRQKGLALALKAYTLWRQSGRVDRADDELCFARYRLTNRYNREMAARYACRRSRSTPQVSTSQRELFKERNEAIYWWLGANEEERVEWLSSRLPRYLGAKDCPEPALQPDSQDYQWVEAILNIGMLGDATRRVLLEKASPANHILNGPEWRVLSGQRVFALEGDEAKKLVDRYLAELRTKLS